MAHWIGDPQGRLEVEKVTKEMKLPVWKANHKGKFRDFWNELWDKIEDYVVKLKGDTEKNSKGLNDRLVSAVGKHDGDFPISNAVVGNVYYSELTKKYYKCKIGGPAPMPNGNFIDLSILENLNRLENLSISDGTEILVKNFSNKSNFTVQEIIWTEEEYRKAIKNYDFISLYFSSSYISIQGPLLAKTTRPYVSIPSANGNTFYLFLAEDKDFIKVMNTVNFSPIKCNELKIFGFKIR